MGTSGRLLREQLLTESRVVLSATHEKALDVVDLEDLEKFAVEEEK